MNRRFEDLVKRMSPTLRKITRKLNGHFSFFDDDDLFQEALVHLWFSFQEGKLADKTDSYILQGCYFYLKNYIRKAIDGANLVSLSSLLDEDTTLDEVLYIEDSTSLEDLDYALLEDALDESGLSDREREVLSCCIDGLTTREIGKRLGISHVAVVKLRNKIKIRCKILRDRLKNGYQR